MRAVQAKEFGGPEVLVPVTLPGPVPGPGEVLIDVAYIDTIFVETQIRTGWGREFFPTTPPYVPGGGVSGVVAALGPEVPEEWLGRRVASYVQGGYASQAVAATSALTVVPDGLDLLPAAALVHDGVTASGLIELTAVAPGDRVLILGASGGMGTLLVQLACSRGALVVGLARGEEKLALVKELGAEAAVDVSGTDWPERARAALDGAADVVLDGVGGQLGATALLLTADAGRFSAHGAPSGAFATVDTEDAVHRGIKLFGIADVQFSPTELHRLTTYAFEEAMAGRLRPMIGEVFELERASAAHAVIEGRGWWGRWC